ncbi:MAG: GAF and ANTAR domain-containing protein [Aeromicrobium sp.]
MNSNLETSNFDAESFAQLAEELHAAGDVAETVEQVIDTALKVLEADRASITMIRRGQRLETIAPTDPTVEQLDQLQYDLREGPCYDASWRGETLISRDLVADVRWPRWAPKAAANGISSMMAVELATVDERVGALNLYYDQPHQFSADDVAFASIFGRHASIALSYKSENAGLTVALDSRKLIGQAQGILMERYDMSELQAFNVLNRYSQNHNIKLREVAERLRSTGKLPKAE